MHIKVTNLKKTFHVAERKSGLQASVKHFFKRTYREVHAINDLSFTIGKGELVGYLGPNGAGKSTTIKMLTGILVPDEGEIRVGGNIPWKNRKEHAEKIGVIFGQKSQLWWDLPLMDSFELLKAIYRIPDRIYNKQFHWLIEGLKINEYITQPVRQLSLGQRMRAELVASLLHLPEVLFLDEPTIGLDATSKKTVREFVKVLNREYGTTVILTTHDMDDIEALCNRVMVIDHGKMAFDGSLELLRKKVHNMRRMEIDYFGHFPENVMKDVNLISSNGEKAIIEFNPEICKAEHVIGWISHNVEIKDLLIENPPIEEIISRLYGDLS